MELYLKDLFNTRTNKIYAGLILENIKTKQKFSIVSCWYSNGKTPRIEVHLVSLDKPLIKILTLYPEEKIRSYKIYSPDIILKFESNEGI